MSKLDELMALAEEYGSCMCAIDASTPMSEARDWAEYKTAKDALESALKALVEDAERYQWLRDSSYPLSRVQIEGSGTWSVSGSQLDAAIDAARKA